MKAQPPLLYLWPLLFSISGLSSSCQATTQSSHHDLPMDIKFLKIYGAKQGLLVCGYIRKYIGPYPDDCKDMIMQYSIDINTPNYFNFTPLHDEAWEGNLESVIKLCRLEANVDGKDNQGKTALFHAASQGHMKVVKYLHQKGANPLLKNKKGVHTIDQIARLQRNNIIAYFRSCLPTLLEKVQEEREKLKLAIQLNAPDVLLELLQKGILPGPQTPFERHPCHVAIVCGHTSILKSLYAIYPGWIKIESRHGDTLLHVAASFHNLEAISFLCKCHGSAIHKENRARETPLDSAIEKRDREAQKEIKKWGGERGRQRRRRERQQERERQARENKKKDENRDPEWGCTLM